ncbi:MAG: hypothetical protein ACLVHD_10195 [Clostridium sp.]|jgi:hypothetical protein
MAKQQLINRAKYKDIKRYDHNQMERFARSLYESGLKDGAVQATETEKSNTRQMDFNMLNERLLTIKGIGIVKAEQIVKVVKGALESE